MIPFLLFPSLTALQVIFYVKAILSDRSAAINPKEIGIISPYRKQVLKLRSALQKEKSFNGKEITVRSLALLVLANLLSRSARRKSSRARSAL